ncbi:MAG: hypothetical protein SFU55_11215 [Methylophilus sp.]|nr:hypothetical protein [Methylophilus sp.]
MNDPLSNFDWLTLYERYDSRCSGFNQNALKLSIFDRNDLSRPSTDRELYYKLVSIFSPLNLHTHAEPIEAYEALLYWKLYSQKAAISNLEKIWLPEHSTKRVESQDTFKRLLSELPITIEHSGVEVIELIKWLGKFNLPGMASSTAIPVRTTFLHFIYPEVVPIFDRMVLRAIGVLGKNANQSYKVLSEYLPFSWGLAEKYRNQIALTRNESPIRAIDMALWVGRGIDQ